MSGPSDSVRSVSAREAWEMSQRGDVTILDLRTRAERRRYGWPPGVRKVSLTLHMWRPRGEQYIYMCQHANRSKLTGRNGAAEIERGWQGWIDADLPVSTRSPSAIPPPQEQP